MVWQRCLFEPFIHSGKAAIRRITSHIQKLALLPADGAGFRRGVLNDGVAAVAAFPSVFGKGGIFFCHDFILSLK